LGGAGKRAPGDIGAPGRRRLCFISGGVNCRPCSRLPWLSTTGIVWGEGEGGATQGGMGGGKGGGRSGVGRHCDVVPPPCPCHGMVNLAWGARELHQKLRTTNTQQSKVDKGCFLTRGSQFCAPTNTPPKDTICHWDWREGMAGFNLAQKGRAGVAIIMRWMMTTMMMARGGSKGKSIILEEPSGYPAQPG
jgi:hypothetical protein